MVSYFMVYVYDILTTTSCAVNLWPMVVVIAVIIWKMNEWKIVYYILINYLIFWSSFELAMQGSYVERYILYTLCIDRRVGLFLYEKYKKDANLFIYSCLMVYKLLYNSFLVLYYLKTNQ